MADNITWKLRARKLDSELRAFEVRPQNQTTRATEQMWQLTPVIVVC